jgi:hypothetical protein
VSRTSSFFNSLREICCAKSSLLEELSDFESYHKRARERISANVEQRVGFRPRRRGVTC